MSAWSAEADRVAGALALAAVPPVAAVGNGLPCSTFPIDTQGVLRPRVSVSRHAVAVDGCPSSVCPGLGPDGWCLLCGHGSEAFSGLVELGHAECDIDGSEFLWATR